MLGRRNTKQSSIQPFPLSRKQQGRCYAEPFRTRTARRLIPKVLHDSTCLTCREFCHSVILAYPARQATNIPKGSMSVYGIYLGLKVGIWEPLWALSIYHIPTWTLWDQQGAYLSLHSWNQAALASLVLPTRFINGASMTSAAMATAHRTEQNDEGLGFRV